MSVNLVHVIDDEQEERDTVQWLLEKYDFDVRPWNGPRSFLRVFDDSIPSIVLMDLNMPDMDGLECLEILSQEEICAPIVMMSGFGTLKKAMQAVKLGALDFVEKPIQAETLLETLRQAQETADQRFSAARYAKVVAGRLSALTNREREVFGELIAGKTNKMISRDLNVSERTVEVHRSAVMRKTGARNLADLIQLAQ